MNYLFSLSNKTFSGSKYPTKKLLNFENRSTDEQSQSISLLIQYYTVANAIARSVNVRGWVWALEVATGVAPDASGKDFSDHHWKRGQVHDKP